MSSVAVHHPSDAEPTVSPDPLEENRSDATHRYEVLQRLSAKQEHAIGFLAIGLSDQATADHVGVHRVTITRWRLNDDAFRDVFTKRMGELWAVSFEQLRALVPRALDTLHWALECGDERTRVKVALELVRLAACEGRSIQRNALPSSK